MSNVFYLTRWRLIYLDDRQIDESLNGGTIMDRRPNPVEMQLIDLAGKPMLRIEIPPGFRPIFYRRKFMDVPLDGRPVGDPQLAGTVFGYGREEGSRMNGKLWMWRDGRAMDCPQQHIDQTAIELQLQAA